MSKPPLVHGTHLDARHACWNNAAAYSTAPPAHNAGQRNLKRIGTLAVRLQTAREFVMHARRIVCVQPPAPFGDVTMAPAALTGRAEADMARAVAAGHTDAECLPLGTRRRQPALLSRSLSARLAALGTLMERRWRFS
jgi:hypothetical protein